MKRFLSRVFLGKWDGSGSRNKILVEVVRFEWEYYISFLSLENIYSSILNLRKFILNIVLLTPVVWGFTFLINFIIIRISSATICLCIYLLVCLIFAKENKTMKMSPDLIFTSLKDDALFGQQNKKRMVLVTFILLLCHPCRWFYSFFYFSHF